MRSVLDILSGPLDGTQKETYFAGRVYIVAKDLADNFVAKGWADETTEPVSS